MATCPLRLSNLSPIFKAQHTATQLKQLRQTNLVIGPRTSSQMWFRGKARDQSADSISIRGDFAKPFFLACPLDQSYVKENALNSSTSSPQNSKVPFFQTCKTTNDTHMVKKMPPQKKKLKKTSGVRIHGQVHLGDLHQPELLAKLSHLRSKGPGETDLLQGSNIIVSSSFLNIGMSYFGTLSSDGVQDFV